MSRRGRGPPSGRGRGPGRVAGVDRVGLVGVVRLVGLDGGRRDRPSAGCGRPLEDQRGTEDRQPARDLDRGEPLVEQEGGQRDADDRLEQHQDPGPGPADEPDPGQEQDRRDGRREQPGEGEQRQDRRVPQRVGERGAGAGQQGQREPAHDRRGQDHGHRLGGRDLLVAGLADDHEDGLAERRAQGQPEPDRIEPDPRRRIEFRGDHRDHARDRESEGDDPRPIERLAPERDVDDRHDDRVGVEAEQGEGDGHQVERDEHREVEGEAHECRDCQAEPGAAVEVAEPGQAHVPAPDPPGDEDGRAGQSDQPAPHDERQRLHPGVIGEPRQRTERPEQGRGHDDDDEARDGRAILGRHGDMVGPMPATGQWREAAGSRARA